MSGKLFDQAGNRKYLIQDERDRFLKTVEQASASFNPVKAGMELATKNREPSSCGCCVDLLLSGVIKAPDFSSFTSQSFILHSYVVRHLALCK